MAFVVRADDDGRISWVTPPNERGFPALADRSKAAVEKEFAIPFRPLYGRLRDFAPSPAEIMDRGVADAGLDRCSDGPEGPAWRTAH